MLFRSQHAIIERNQGESFDEGVEDAQETVSVDAQEADAQEAVSAGAEETEAQGDVASDAETSGETEEDSDRKTGDEE